MVEDRMTCASSPAQKPSKKDSVDLDVGLGSAQLKAMNGTDPCQIRISGEHGLSEVDDKEVHHASNEARFEASDFPAPHSVSSKNPSDEKLAGNCKDEKQAGNCSDGGENGSAHQQVHVFDKECDPGAVKDIWIDEGVPTQTKNGLGSQDSVKIEEHRGLDPTQTKASEPLPDISSTTFAHQASANYSLDFESLLDQVVAEKIGTQCVSDRIADRSFLDELMLSANNPFLEDPPFEASSEGERDAVRLVRSSNPFDFDGMVNEAEGNCVGEEVTSNDFLSQTLDNDLVIEGLGQESGTQSEEKMTPNDTKLEAAPTATSTVDSGAPGVSDNKKLPRHADIPDAQLQHDAMESSFASMNPYPALVSHSGQIPFSGSMSLRSESSAASNGSFAFPVLQTEWNSSPVKMAKGNRRQLRKNNGWRHTLLCCNF